jgi:ABC-2 type transport system permease protein
VLSRVNPLTYVVDALRALLLTQDFSHLAIDISVVALSVVFMVSLATLAFRRIID